jgi:hypothetical protein
MKPLGKILNHVFVADTAGKVNDGSREVVSQFENSSR